MPTILAKTLTHRFLQRPIHTRKAFVDLVGNVPSSLFRSTPGSRRKSSQVLGMSTAVASGVRDSYTKLQELLRAISRLEDVSEFLEWDEMVCLPNGASDARGLQKSALAGVVHDHKTAKELGDLIGDLKSDQVAAELNEYERAVVRIAKRNWRKDNALSKELVGRDAALKSKGYSAWLEAREKNDFQIFAPVLKEIVEIKKEIAASIDTTLPPYDVLLDEFEPGMTCTRLNQLFGEVKPFLVDLIARTQVALADEKVATKFDLHRFDGSYDVKTQENVGEEIARDIGYDMDHGRLDVSVHPFTCKVGGPKDVRITTRYNDKEILEGLLGIIHECGHAMYSQGLNVMYDGLPVAQPSSSGLDEGQALTWEWYVGRTQQFWAYCWPKLRKALPSLPDVPSDDFYMAMNRVTPSMIRVDADELTYPLHVILRYEIEQGLVDGSINVENVPEIWNKKMVEYLGIHPKTDLEGCLQDVHWSSGYFAYFPTYSLGAMYGAQLFACAENAIPNLKVGFSNGRFSEFREWLKENVHMKGCLFPTADALLKEVTGDVLNTRFYEAYLKEKYETLYGLH